MPVWTLNRRAERMQASAIREILKLTAGTEVLSLAGGLPAAEGFPVDAVRAATERVWRDHALAALQYGPSEGLMALREWVAQHLRARGMAVPAEQVLITHGSQQGLDLVAKVLLDEGVPAAVENPTYLGALQAFAPFGPRLVGVAADAGGVRPEAIDALPARASGCRLLYLMPNFQNPTGACLSAERRQAVVCAAQRAGVPLLEDDPYGELWYHEPPAAPLAALWPEGTVYLGSFSKVLAPGLRLGYVVAPPGLFGKLLQAKQAADLHTSMFTQHLVLELVRSGLLPTHLSGLRASYRARRDALHAALQRHLPAGCRWQVPEGGMFFWVRLPPGSDTSALLRKAIEAGVAFVPGAACHVEHEDSRTMRLSFVTLSPDRLDEAVRRLAHGVRAQLGG